MLKFIKSFRRPLVIIGDGCVELVLTICAGVKDLFGWFEKLLGKLSDKCLSYLVDEEETATET